MLETVFGVRNIVKKKRTVFIVGRTRIHFDDVEMLERLWN